MKTKLTDLPDGAYQLNSLTIGRPVLCIYGPNYTLCKKYVDIKTGKTIMYVDIKTNKPIKINNNENK